MRFVPLLSLAACALAGAFEEDVCHTEIIYSVTVDVVDPAGAPVSPTSVRWSVDGVEQEGECVDDACTQFLAGEDVAGEITVAAELSGVVPDAPCCTYDGVTDSETVSVEMDAQGCHVIGESATLVLDPSQRACVDDCG